MDDVGVQREPAVEPDHELLAERLDGRDRATREPPQRVSATRTRLPSSRERSAAAVRQIVSPSGIAQSMVRLSP
jgi:hypothetical protein